MKDLHIPHGSYGDTPELSASITTQQIELKGFVFTTYEVWQIEYAKPLLNWLYMFWKKYPDKIINIDIKFDSCNTAVLKGVYEILQTLDKNTFSKKTIINWYYEKNNEDIYYAGEELKEDILNTSFNMIIQ